MFQQLLRAKGRGRLDPTESTIFAKRTSTSAEGFNQLTIKQSIKNRIVVKCTIFDKNYRTQNVILSLLFH